MSEIKLNAPAVLGEKLTEIGITSVKIIRDVYISNDADYAIIAVSPKKFYRLRENIKHLLRFSDKEIKEL